jgi:hypothetical protein
MQINYVGLPFAAGQIIFFLEMEASLVVWVWSDQISVCVFGWCTSGNVCWAFFKYVRNHLQSSCMKENRLQNGLRQLKFFFRNHETEIGSFFCEKKADC